ncbi:MAG: hypothetical protein AB1644_04650 [Candidatus Zixiibacteriota bacterium]
MVRRARFSGRYSTAHIMGLLFGINLLVAAAYAADPVRFALTDLRVMYLFEQPEDIDWGTIYYLNDQHGCEVDLVSLRPSATFMHQTTELAGSKLALRQCVVGDTTAVGYDSLLLKLYGDRPPNIVVFGDVGAGPLYRGLRIAVLGRALDTTALFGISKVYQLGPADQDTIDSRSSVLLNPREKYELYRQRIQDEVPRLLPRLAPQWYSPPSLIRYSLVYRSPLLVGADADFVSGLPTWQLPTVLEACLPDGAVKEAYLRRSRTVISYLVSARNGVEQLRMSALVGAYEEAAALSHQVHANRALMERPGLGSYINDLMSGVTNALLRELGIRWNGKIIVRDSPDGPKLKFVASLSAEGGASVQLASVRFLPYWDSADVILDSVQHAVSAHQTFVQEYLVDVAKARLEAEQPESLLFIADVTTGNLTFPFQTAMPIWEAPDVSVRFQPSFYFIPPVAQLNIDKVVASMHWQAVISKPTYYRGSIGVNLETPKGMFAGAYQSRLSLEKGRTRHSFSIPFSVSNLFELGVQEATVSLSLNGRMVTADTGRIRIAACQIDDTIKIAFLPDSTGLLEDVLRMTGAGFQPLTDRSLTTSDLSAYNVIVIGSGSFREFPSLRAARGGFEDFVRAGGSLIILGQPPDWPQGILPLELTPGTEELSSTDIFNQQPTSELLRAPYQISDQGLLEPLSQKAIVASAVVSPGDKLYVSPSGAAILSVTRLGNGSIVYCGYPLLDMIAELNIDAIHLFANLLNY